MIRMNTAHGTHRSLKTWLREWYRSLKGGEPVPEAADRLSEYVSNRPNLPLVDWVSGVRQAVRSDSEVAGFVFDFLAGRGVPVGSVRPDDRLEEDLHLTEVLRQDWADDFQVDFAKHFGVFRLFRSGPRIVTVAELVSFVQLELDDWRSNPKQG